MYFQRSLLLMAVLRTSLLTLMLVYTTYCSPSPVSARDQYEAREDWSQPPQLFNEATDQSFKMHKVHRFGLPLKKSALESEHQKNDVVPDLQVGCGDGFIVEPTSTNKMSKVSGHETLKQRRKRNADRKQRQYFASTHIIRTPSSVSYTVWRPQTHQINRPYYVPVLGASGRVPIYFPAQPVLINPGYPVHNPPVRGYLPPTSTTTPKSIIRNRFLGNGNDDEDLPIWGVFTRPPTSTTTTIRPPTRRTRRPGQTTTHPPLLHIPHSIDEVDDTISNELEAVPPPEIEKAIDDVFYRPSAPVPPPPPAEPQTQRPGRQGQSMNCVFAIISCCSATSNNVDLNCFELRGCPGPFWGANPCDTKFANAALGSASNYFNA